jgi:hypothetical protein
MAQGSNPEGAHSYVSSDAPQIGTLTGGINSVILNPGKGQQPLSSFNFLHPFVAPLTAHRNAAMVYTAPLQTVIDLVAIQWRADPLAFPPFNVQKLLRSKHLGEERQIYNFMPLSGANGRAYSANRYDDYSRLISEGCDAKENEKTVKVLWSRDAIRLNNNDVSAWMEALTNWIQFLHMVINFKPEILEALLKTVVRFEKIMRLYDYGVTVPETQKALFKGSLMFTKEVVDVLTEGQRTGSEGVVKRLEEVPVMSIGTLLQQLLETVSAERIMRLVGEQATADKKTGGKRVAPPDSDSDEAGDGAPRRSGPKRDKKSKFTKKAGERVVTATPVVVKQEVTKVREGAAATPQTEGKSRSACIFFLSARGCTKEGNCRYNHHIPREKEQIQRLATLLKTRELERSAGFATVCANHGVTD